MELLAIAKGKSDSLSIMFVKTSFTTGEDSVARLTPCMMIVVVAYVLSSVREMLVAVLAVVVIGTFTPVTLEGNNASEINITVVTDMVVVREVAVANMVVPIVGPDVAALAVVIRHGY